MSVFSLESKADEALGPDRIAREHRFVGKVMADCAARFGCGQVTASAPYDIGPANCIMFQFPVPDAVDLDAVWSFCEGCLT